MTANNGRTLDPPPWLVNFVSFCTGNPLISASIIVCRCCNPSEAHEYRNHPLSRYNDSFSGTLASQPAQHQRICLNCDALNLFFFFIPNHSNYAFRIFHTDWLLDRQIFCIFELYWTLHRDNNFICIRIVVFLWMKWENRDDRATINRHINWLQLQMGGFWRCQQQQVLFQYDWRHNDMRIVNQWRLWR